MKTPASHYLPLLVGCLFYRATDMVNELQSAVSPDVEVLNTSLHAVQWKRTIHSPIVIWHNAVVPVDQEYGLDHSGYGKHKRRHRSHSHCSKNKRHRSRHHSAGCGKCRCCRAHARHPLPLQYVASYVPRRGFYSANTVHQGKCGNNLDSFYFRGYGGPSTQSHWNSYLWA